MLRSYSADYDLPEAVASRHLEVQQRGASIIEVLQAAAGSNYAGAWFDNQAGEFVVPVVGGGDAIVSSALDQIGLRGSFRVVNATRSWAELQEIQKHVDSQLLALVERGLVQTGLDPRVNSVVIDVAGDVKSQQRSHIMRIGRANAVDVRVRRLDRFRISVAGCDFAAKTCGSPLRGGVRIERPGANCTAAFPAESNINGSKLILTAGHCIWGSETWSTADPDQGGVLKPIGSAVAYTFPNHDWAAINVNGSAWDVSPWTSSVAVWGVEEQRQITSESPSYLGQQVCHIGITTGTNCGTVTGLDKTVPYGNSKGEVIGHGYHTTEVKGEGFCVISGDSGGPVIAGSVALGIISQRLPGDVCPNTGYYMEITEATAALGVTVVREKPIAVTKLATDIQETQARLNGAVNPQGHSTIYKFEYGTTTNYGSSVPVPPASAGAGVASTEVNLVATNLQPNTHYHYRLVATNSQGTSYGEDRSFTTGVRWLLRNSNTSGVPTSSFWFGLPGFVRVAGDWDGNGTETPGAYNPATGEWRLRNSNSTGSANLSFSYGGGPWTKPVVGDWDGDGDDTIGVYDPVAGNWNLRNTNSGGSPNYSFQYGGGTWSGAVTGDWDGDGDDTIGVYDPTAGNWNLRNTNSGGSPNYSFQYGGSQFKPVTGDWDGNGTTTIGLYEPTAGQWNLRNANSGGNPDLDFQYGGSQFEPVVADWDGNGTTTVGLTEPNASVQRTWLPRNQLSSGNSEAEFTYGWPAEVVVSGDWDNDGDSTPGVYLASSGIWKLTNSSTGGGPTIQFSYGGGPWTKPVVGDWDGDGDDTIGVYDPVAGNWNLRNTNSGGSPNYSFQYGGGTWSGAVTGDWDGDGDDTIGVYDPVAGNWNLRNTNSGGSPNYSFQYGGSQFKPVTGDWNGNGTTTIGLYEPTAGSWALRNTNGSGSPDISFQYGGSQYDPVTGDWNGDGSSGVGLATK